jgi:hypothetical protein
MLMHIVCWLILSMVVIGFVIMGAIGSSRSGPR